MNWTHRIFQNLRYTKIALYFVVLMLLAFILHTGMAPVNKLHELKQVIAHDSAYLERYQNEYEAPDISALARMNAYREALVSISQNDSISLIINLEDSTANLAIHGVIIHTAGIQYLKIDPLLTRLPNRLYLGLFSRPLKMVHEWSTIVKEPVVVRQAPKDPAEASLNVFKPDTLIQNPAFLKLELERGIGLIIEQDKNPTVRDKWVWLKFRATNIFKTASAKLYRFVTFRRQTYCPTVKIKIHTDDLRTIYRALPSRPYVVLYYQTT